MPPGSVADVAAVPLGLEETERVFGALAHEVRRHIVQLLSHLEAAGLVSVRREGRSCVYRLERDRLRHVVGSWLALLDPPTPERTWRSSGPRTITKGRSDD